MDNYAKENISTKQPPQSKETRISRENGDEERTQRNQTPQSERTQEINGSPLLDFRLPKSARLRKPGEFRRVYAEGKRFEGRLMTVFITPSNADFSGSALRLLKKLSAMPCSEIVPNVFCVKRFV